MEGKLARGEWGIMTTADQRFIATVSLEDLRAEFAAVRLLTKPTAEDIEYARALAREILNREDGDAYEHETE